MANAGANTNGSQVMFYLWCTQLAVVVAVASLLLLLLGACIAIQRVKQMIDCGCSSSSPWLLHHGLMANTQFLGVYRLAWESSRDWGMFKQTPMTDQQPKSEY